MKLALLTALTALFWTTSTSALISSKPTILHQLTGDVTDGSGPIGEVLNPGKAGNSRRSRVAPGDSNAERLARGVAPKAPAGVFHKKATKTAGAKRQAPSSIGGSYTTANLLAYTQQGAFVGAFYPAADKTHVTLSKTLAIQFELDPTASMQVPMESLPFQNGGITFYLASYVVPKGGDVGDSSTAYIQFGFANLQDYQDPVDYCYYVGAGYETANWGWGQGISNTYASYQWFDPDPSGAVLPGIFQAGDGYLYAAYDPSDIPSSPPLTEDDRLTLFWVT